MANPTRTTTSHGQGAKGAAPAVSEHETYGGGKREEVAGGPSGRGNTGARMADTERDWARGDAQEGNDGIPEMEKPVAGGNTPKNPFSA